MKTEPRTEIKKAARELAIFKREAYAAAKKQREHATVAEADRRAQPTTAPVVVKNASGTAYVYRDRFDGTILRLNSNMVDRLGGNDTHQSSTGQLAAALSERRGGVFLDAGAGMGRWIVRFGRLFSRVVAAEPDNLRFTVLQRVVPKFLDPTRVQLHNGFISTLDVPNATFDAILSSHVVQHIAISVAHSYFRRVRELLKPDGLFVVATTYSPIYWCHTNAGKVLNDEEFEKFALQTEPSDLPVRHFSDDRLMRELRDAGLKARRWWAADYLSEKASGGRAKQFRIPKHVMALFSISQGFVLSPA